MVNSTGVLAAIRDGRADVGFVEGFDPLDEFDAKVVAHDEIVLAVAAGHRWAHRRAVNPKELAGGRWISRETGSGMRAVATAALAERGVELRPDLSLASLEGVKRSLAAGGFALISNLALEPDLARRPPGDGAAEGPPDRTPLDRDPAPRRTPDRRGPPLLGLAADPG